MALSLTEVFTMGLFLIAVMHLILVYHVYYIKDAKTYFYTLLGK